MPAAAAEVPWAVLSKAAGACDELLLTLPNRKPGACCAEGFGTCGAEKMENHDELGAKWVAQQVTLIKKRRPISKQVDARNLVTGCRRLEEIGHVGDWLLKISMSCRSVRLKRSVGCGMTVDKNQSL